jgi:HD superfamily phosphohydrolase
MSGTWPKVILDPVHNIIPFEDSECDRLLLELINTREFQRLRRIKQLGMSELVFPGSNHSRFAHSIGVMHTARMFLERIGRLRKTTDDEKAIVLTASLLHDIGHGPFSHAFEKVTREDHEQRTTEIIKDPSTEINKRLRSCDPTLPDKLEDFFEGEDGVGVAPFFRQIVSSQLDADRFDYLLRDSYGTGTDYGEFDLKWLIQHLELDEGKHRTFLNRKAAITAEAYVFARYHMYRTVYFHKTTRSAEVMLRLVLKRYADLLRDCTSKEQRQTVVSDAPAAVLTAFSGTRMTLEQYLALDDFAMGEFFKACESCDDVLLRQLGSGLLNRQLYKAVEATGASNVAVGDFTTEVAEFLTRKGLDREYSFVADSVADTPYKPYNPDAEVQETQIFVETPTGRQVEISSMSEPVKELTKKYNLLRYFYPSEIRNEVEAIAARTLHKV